MPMLTDFKVLSLAFKCVIYRLEHNVKGEPLLIEF